MQISGIRRALAGSAAVAVLAVAAAGPAAAQAQRSVRGTVLDAADGRPVAAAQVLVEAPGRSALTDGEGRYELADLAAGPVVLEVRRIGYAPAARRITVAPAGVTRADFTLTAQATELAPIVVTANRERQSLTEVPAAVSVVDSTALAGTRTAGLHEVLRNTPGVQATSRYGLDDVNLSIRGAGARTTFGVRGVAVLVDGVPLTEPDGLTRLDLIELGSARQVEVVRGPASAVYGGVASGGAINVITRSGHDSRGVTARLQRGSHDFEKYQASLGTTFADDRGSLYLSGARTYSRGFREFNDNGMTRLNLRGDYRPFADTRVALEASTSDLAMHIPGALNREEFDADPYAAAPGNVANRYARRDERFRVGARLDQRFDAGRPVETSAYAFYGGRTLDHPIYQVLDQSLHRIQLGTRIRFPVGPGDDPRAQVTLGLDYDNLYGSDRRYRNQAGERGALLADGTLSLPNIGVYGQTRLRLSDRVGATAGLRYDRVRYNLGNRLDRSLDVVNVFEQLSPKLTLTYRLGGGSTLYGSVARGFEVPTSGEIQFSPDTTRVYNDALDPKTLWNYEVGLKTLLADRLLLDVAVYHAEIDGEFIGRSAFIQGAARTVYENAGHSRHNGLEVSATALVSDAVDLVGSYTLSDFTLTEFTSGGVDYSGNRLPGVPRHRLTGELRARPVERLSAGLAVEWQSRVFVDNANTERGTVTYTPFGAPDPVTVPFTAVDPFALVHLSASYRLGGATVFAGVENLFDTRYVGNVTINDGQGRFYSAGAGRYVSIGMGLSAFGGGW